MAEEAKFWIVTGIIAVAIFFIAPKVNVGTQSFFGGFGGEFFSTTPGLILLGLVGIMVFIGFFIPKSGK